MTAIKWLSPPALVSYFVSTELNSQANNATVLGAAIANATSLYRYMAVDLFLNTFLSAPVAGGRMNLFLLPAVDPANYPDGSSTILPPAETLVYTFNLDATTVAKRKTGWFIIPPFDFKLALQNISGQALASASNTLKYRLFAEEIV